MCRRDPPLEILEDRSEEHALLDRAHVEEFVFYIEEITLHTDVGHDAVTAKGRAVISSSCGMTVSEIIYGAAGSPNIGEGQAGSCRTCGCSGIGTLFSKWVKPTFTDWDKITSGDIICQACLFCFDDLNPTLDAKLDRPRQRMRNYSHFVVDGEWTPLSKGNKTRMAKLLLSNPSVAVIAESGQKHILFRASPGLWQFEESRILPDSEALADLAAIIQPLYDGGFAKSEIHSGRYNQKRILSFGLARWHENERLLRPLRGSRLFTIALFLAQKEAEDGDDNPDARADR